MKKIFLSILFFLISTLLYAGYSFSPLLFIPWGDDEYSVRYETSPGGRFGPTAFHVEDNYIQILDARNQVIKVFDRGTDSLVQKISVPHEVADDFLLMNGEVYLLTGNCVIKMSQGKSSDGFTPSHYTERITGLYKGEKDLIYMPTTNGKTFFLDKNKQQAGEILEGIVLGNHHPVSIQFKPGNSAHVSTSLGKSFVLDIDNMGLIRLIGNDSRGDLYFYCEQIIQQAPLKVKRSLCVTTAEGFEHTRIDVPLYMWTEIFREFYVDNEGNIYHMMSTEEGIQIVAWLRTDGDDTFFQAYSYPDSLNKEIHFNQEKDTKWEGNSENTHEKSSSKGVTRDEALAFADTYVKHIWQCRAENLTNGRITVNGIEVETPSWIKIGQNQKIPYKWGGFNTLDQFDAGLLNNKYAGDIATSGVSNAAVGVDCSGFVSRCWNLSSHYSTSMMNSTPALFTKVADWNQFLPADGLLKVGHVRLGVLRNADGSILAVEAAGSGTGWKVDYRNYTLANLTDYTLLKYTGISGGTGWLSQPELLSVFSLPGDSVRIEWTPFTQKGDETGIKIFFESLEGIELTVKDTIIPLNKNVVLLPKPADPLFVTLVSVDDAGNESIPSDSYGTSGIGLEEPFLLVDGFTRTGSGASYVLPYHDFSLAPAKALSHWNISYNTCAAKSMSEEKISLMDYPDVFWNVGDESTIDETFSNQEQELIKEYLQQGGRFAATGSEIGWDLDNKGSASDKDFIHNYLKAAYDVDDAGKGPVKILTGVYQDNYIDFDDGSHGIYEEDYPDGIRPINGGVAFLEYQSNSSYVAGVSFQGVVPNGTSECRTALVGFPFETVWDKEHQLKVMATLLYELGFDSYPLTIHTPTLSETFVLQGNFPNPFNASTTIRFALPIISNIIVTIYDITGKNVFSQRKEDVASGTHRLSVDLSGFSSGLYVYQISAESLNETRTGKMTFIK
ncbi:MAG: T9SS type A sorting domain-containing protein [Candidatus Marinimicrobia bacterium]|nr:T9SS type A sorting domain-containing protein [Candidatus Neomarinimicrobiota bacterium]